MGSDDLMTRAPDSDMGHMVGKMSEALNVCVADVVGLVRIALGEIHDCANQGYLHKNGPSKDSEASVIYRDNGAGGAQLLHTHCRSIWTSPHSVQVDIFVSISQLFMLLAFDAVLA